MSYGKLNENDVASRPNVGESRREMLRKGAMVGGLVWAAPVIGSAGRLAAEGSAPPSTSTTEPNFVTSTSVATTTTTMATLCDCTFCATITTPAGATLYFIGSGRTEADCDCLCKCGGIDRPCNAPDPCVVDVAFTPSPVPCS